MAAFSVPPTADTATSLPSADFADAFAIDVEEATLDAPEAARRAVEQMPAWATYLLRLRNVLVVPFGLKGGADPVMSTGQRYGIFPVVSSSPQRVVMGFDDRHLDFRLVVDVATLGERTKRVTATTLVHRNNTFGRLYLAAVMPFHKLIVPAALGQIVR
jgi:hypothetical protein